MKTHLFRLIAIFTLLLLTTQLYAKTIYRWIDKSGKQHFSDKPSESRDAKKFEGQPLTNIRLVSSKQLKAAKTPKRKSASRKNNRAQSKPTQCVQLKNKIALIESKLKQRLLAEKADQYSRDLNNLKWRKIKSC
jgi:hypothetical protein